jgi:two-component system sensor histidine kinase ChiS
MRGLGRVRVRGRQEPVGIYEVFAGDPPALFAQKQATRAAFEEALRLYRAGAFGPAQAGFQAVLAAAPDDSAARWYVARTATYLAHGAPADWAGVEVLVEE